MTQTKKTLRRALKARRGQAMMSYALITMILLGGLVGSTALIVPQVFKALDSYSANIYFCINAPIP